MPDERRDDDWTGSMKKPGYNPPARKGGSGAGRGAWRWTIAVIALVVVAAVVVLALVQQDVLARGWAYVVLPFAIFAAALSRVVTILKARSEETADDEKGP